MPQAHHLATAKRDDHGGLPRCLCAMKRAHIVSIASCLMSEAGVQSLAEKFKLDERAAYKLSEAGMTIHA